MHQVHCGQKKTVGCFGMRANRGRAVSIIFMVDAQYPPDNQLGSIQSSGSFLTSLCFASKGTGKIRRCTNYSFVSSSLTSKTYNNLPKND